MTKKAGPVSGDLLITSAKCSPMSGNYFFYGYFQFGREGLRVGFRISAIKGGWV